MKDFDFERYVFKHPVADYILLAITVLSVILLLITVANISKGNMAVKIVSVKNRSVDLINYTIPYIVSFFGIDLSKPEDIISITIFLLIMLILTITSKSVFLNPILALAGYGLYDLEYEFDGKKHSTVVISKHELYNGERFYIRSLTRFLYFVTEEKKNNDAD